jgi:hypothetical protein
VSRITVARAAVPEATTLVLFALGLFGTASAFRRRVAQA